MNDAKIIALTQPLLDGDKIKFGEQQKMTPNEFIAYTARVSNPSNQHNTLTSEKLLKYLIEHKHWSPFEMVSVTMEINTTRDISHQIIRHRSFSFQEFSQRYADPTKDMSFVTREARLQDAKNRQNSIEVGDETISSSIGDINPSGLKFQWNSVQEEITNLAKDHYKDAISWGIAKEQARAILPEGLTTTRLYMSGTLRSWIHYIDVRAEEGTQKEHRQVALAAQGEILKHFPSLTEYWYPTPPSPEEYEEWVCFTGKGDTLVTSLEQPKSWWWRFWS